MDHLKKMVVAGILVALAVVCSGFYIPVGIAKCFPVQHAINLIAGVLLGPWYAVGVALITSLIRVSTGMGTLLAFPGSMIGAFCCGLLFAKTNKLLFAYFGEIVGTGVIGAIAAYPIAALILSKEAAVFGFIVPFVVSSIGGATIAIPLILALKSAKVFRVAAKPDHS